MYDLPTNNAYNCSLYNSLLHTCKSLKDENCLPLEDELQRIPYLCINKYSKGARHEGAGKLGTRGAHTGCQTADDVQCSDHLRQTHKDGTLSPSHMTFNQLHMIANAIPISMSTTRLLQFLHVHRGGSPAKIHLFPGSSPAFNGRNLARLIMWQSKCPKVMMLH